MVKSGIVNLYEALQKNVSVDSIMQKVLDEMKLTESCDSKSKAAKIKIFFESYMKKGGDIDSSEFLDSVTQVFEVHKDIVNSVHACVMTRKRRGYYEKKSEVAKDVSIDQPSLKDEKPTEEDPNIGVPMEPINFKKPVNKDPKTSMKEIPVKDLGGDTQQLIDSEVEQSINEASEFIRFDEIPVQKLQEGEFSWLASDDKEPIYSTRGHQQTVWMLDNKGNKWKEDAYDGYGVFGGKDFFELLAEMNGLGSDREAGIDLAYSGKEYASPKLSHTLHYVWDILPTPEKHDNQGWWEGEDEEEFLSKFMDESKVKNCVHDDIDHGTLYEALCEEKDESKVNETVSELVGEIPGISKEEQQILHTAIKRGTINNTLPNYSTMMDKLSKVSGAKKLSGRKFNTAMMKSKETLASKSDVDGMFVKYYLLPKAKKSLGYDEGQVKNETVDVLIDEIYELGVSSGPQEPGWIDEEAVSPIISRIKDMGFEAVKYAKEKMKDQMLEYTTEATKESDVAFLAKVVGLLDESKVNEEEKKYGVVLTGGSVGSKENKPKYFDTKEEADTYRKRMNKRLSPGEKKYYKLKYKTAKESKQLYLCNECCKTFRAVESKCTKCESSDVEQIVKEQEDMKYDASQIKRLKNHVASRKFNKTYDELDEEEKKLVDDVIVDECKLKEYNDKEDDYTAIAKGIKDQEAAEKLAKESDGNVVKDEEDEEKFAVIKKED